MPESEEETEQPEGDATSPAGDLGEAGRKALEAERKARREAEKQIKELTGKLQAIEDRDKSESQRQADQVVDLKQQLAKATLSGARFRVALEHGLTATQAKRLVGDTEDELAADAEQLVEDLGLAKGPEKVLPGSGPQLDLKPGSGDPDEPVPESDPEKLAALVPRDF